MRDTIDMAREAAGGMLSYDSEGQWRLSEMEVMRLVEIVRADEREASASVCEKMGIEGFGTLAIAAAIRARGETK